MNIFLAEMSQYLGAKKAVFVMDQAAWHKGERLVIPDNIKIIHLPPYSPELNPVERLWQYIKNHTLKNKVYNTIEDLEKAIFIKNLAVQSIRSIDY
jgi:transposase